MSGFGTFGKGCLGGGNYGGSGQNETQNSFGRENIRGRGRGRSYFNQSYRSSGFQSNGRGNRGLYHNYSSQRGASKRSFFDNKPTAKRFRHEDQELEVVAEIDPRILQPMPEAVHYIPLVRQKLVPGTVGTPIELVSNFYKLITSNISVYRYLLIISNAKPNKPKLSGKCVKVFTPSLNQLHEHSLKVRKIIMKFIEENPAIFGKVTYAFDAWKNSFCTTTSLNLPAKDFFQKIQLNGKNREFKIKLKFMGPVDLSEASAYYRGETNKISKSVNLVLETVLRFIMSKSYDSFGMKFFNFDSNEPSKYKQFKFHEFIRGFVSTVCRAEFGLALNLHLQTECIISKTYKDLVHFVSDIVKVDKPLEKTFLTEWQIRQVNNAIRGLKIYNSRVPDKFMEVDCIINETPSHRMLFHKEGDKEPQRISMHDFYMKKFDTLLKEYPLVKIKIGNETIVPMEWCCLVDKQFMRRMNDQIKEEFLEKKAIAPNMYFNTANEFVKQIAQSEPELLKQFGLELVGKPSSLYGRVLPAPKQLSSNEDEPFYQAIASSIKWALICFDENISMDKLSFFLVEMRATANKLGLHFSEARKVSIEPVNSVSEVMDVLDKAMQEKQMNDVELFFFAIPKKHRLIRDTNDVYNMLKHRCDQEYGIVSQCINTKCILKLPSSYFDNFLQKVNGKLGGQNTVFDQDSLKSLPFDSSRTMIVGADVNHPDLRLKKVESAIAVLVGSYDSFLTKYTASIRVQERNNEIMGDMESMLDELLNEYYRYNQTYPDNIMFFRNGVSNSKFLAIQRDEMRQLQRSINKTGRNIQLTLIVLQMYTRTRFALPLPKTPSGVPNHNVPSGTVVDQYLVDPYSKEFYLVSQSNEHGTSRPTKYIIFRDDLNLNTDKLQQVCFFLCHNSVRTRKVIGCPIAVRYADLCASRSMKHINAQRSILNLAQSSNRYFSVDKEEESIIQELNTLVKVNDRIKNLLYYC